MMSQSKWHFNALDFSLMGFVALLVVGIICVQSGWVVTSAQMVEGETDVEVVVGIFGTQVLNHDFIKSGDKTAISVRNQPRGEVRIKEAHWKRSLIALVGPSGKVLAAPDPSRPNDYDLYLTLSDHALIGKEGYVANGVKLKVGQPIEVEGFAYRLGGRILDVKAVELANPKSF